MNLKERRRNGDNKTDCRFKEKDLFNQAASGK